MHQEPVYVDPDRTSPVSLFGEPEAVQIVAGDGCNDLISQTESFILEGIDYALCPILLHDTSVQRASEVRPEVHRYRPAIDEVVVQVCPAILIPELLLDGAPGLLRQFLVGRRVLTNNPRYLREIPVRLVKE